MPWWDMVAGGSQPAKPASEGQATSVLSRAKRPRPLSLGSVVGQKRPCALLSCGRTFTAARRGQRFCGRRCRRLARTWPVREAAA
jgi:hypothetical protein